MNYLKKVTGKYPAVLNGKTAQIVEFDTNGVATVKLGAGDELLIKNLPTGSGWEVEENAPGYIISYTNLNGDSGNGSGRHLCGRR